MLPAYVGFITATWAGVFLIIISGLIIFALGVINAHHSALIADNVKVSKLTKGFENRPLRFLVSTLWAIIAAITYNMGLPFVAGLVTAWVGITVFTLFYETLLVGMSSSDLLAQYEVRKDEPPTSE